MGAVAFAANSGGRPIATPFDGNNDAIVTTAAGMRANSAALGSPGDLVNLGQSIIKAGNYLKKMQADVTEDNAGNGFNGSETPEDPDDGGWDWAVTSPPAPFFHTTAASSLNLYGVTALGLYYAYLKTNDATYFTAMQDAANKIIADPLIRTSSDLRFLMLFDDLPSVIGTTYQDAAKAKYDARIVVYGTADSLAKYIRNARGIGQGYPNGIIGWDIGAYVVAAQMLFDRFGGTYAADADAMAEVLWQDSYNNTPGLFDVEDDDGFDPTYGNRNYWWYTLGLSGLLDAFRASNTHTAEIPDLLARLQASQFTTGAISGSYGANAGDEDWQSTGCVIRSLYEYDAATYATEIARGAYWAAVTQDVSGGWLYSDNSHYPEVAAEATYAVTLGTTPDEVWVDDSWTSQADVDVYNLANSTSLVWGYDAFGTIQNGVDGVGSSTVNVLPGTYVLSSTVNLNKANLTIDGAGAGLTIVQVAQAVGYAFSITSPGVTLRGLEIQKTDLGTNHNLIYLAANNISILNNLVYGPDPGSPWSVNGIVSRAMLSTGGLSGLLIDNNTIRTLRQPGYFSGPTTGVISNNMVSGTRGWVNEGAQLTFTGNSWPLPANQGAEIALLSSLGANGPVWYPDLMALSNANNNAYVDAQFTPTGKGRAISYVNASAPSGGFGSILAPVQTVLAGISGALATGAVQVATGNYPEYNLLVNKPLTIQGTGLPTIDATGFAASANFVVDINIASGNVLFDGFKVKPGAHNGIHVNAPAALSVVTITHNELVGNGTNIDVGTGIGYGLIAGYDMLGKVVFSYNQVSEFYQNSLLFEKMLGETEVMHNNFFQTYTTFYMTYGGSNVTTLQKVAFNTFDVGGVDGGSSGFYFNSATNYGPALRVGKYTNIEISDNIFNNVGDNDRAFGLGNDNNVNGTDGEIVAPRILRNTINGTGSVTNCRGIQLIGYITDAVVTDNVISGVQEGIRLWNGLYSPSFYPVRVALTDNTFRNNKWGLLNMLGSLTATSNVFFNNTTNASDNKSGNTYSQNCWSDWSGVGAYAIGGGGGNSDANPNVDCGLDMTPNAIVYDCAGNFTFDVKIGEGVMGLEAANIDILYPVGLNVVDVAAGSSNYLLAYSQVSNTLKVNLGVLTGAQDGPATLFTVTMNGSTSICAVNQLQMTYADLRNSTNIPFSIPTPLATPTTFNSDCNDPTIAVNSPATGGLYNIVPVLSLTATDDCDLNAVYYQIDGCLPGGWLSIATGLTGTTYNNAAWPVPGFMGLSDGSHCIRFKVTDDFGRENAATECTYTWCFTKDVTPPAPPTNLVATPGHNKVNLTWTNASADYNHTVVMRTDWYAGGHGYPEYDDNNAEGPYPISLLTGDQVYSGTGSTQLDVLDLSNGTRDVYHYAAFTVDNAGNVSAASTGARSTSYWLGDIAAAYDGYVNFNDLLPFSNTYGSTYPAPGFNPEADFGPTYNMSPKGIPTTDNKVEFEDLAIFAINYDAVVPAFAKDHPVLPDVSIQSRTGLRIVEHQITDGYRVDLYLDNPSNNAKALIGALSFDVSRLQYASATMSPALSGSALPIFFKPLVDEGTVSISAAVLGNGLTFTGSGLVATVDFRVKAGGKTRVALSHVDIRDNENKRLVPFGTPIPDANSIAETDVASTCSVMQNQPNPFNPETRISYGLPATSRVTLRVYNVVGELVKTLVDDVQAAGQHEVVWNSTNDNNEKVASGIYFYRFTTPDYQKTVKMILLK
jgi:hypothetical protein